MSAISLYMLLKKIDLTIQYIAAKLLEINERGKYVDPETLSPDEPTQNVKLLAQEEEIFQTARLINCGWFGMGASFIEIIIALFSRAP